jgi:hyaluronoglucosaminidase
MKLRDLRWVLFIPLICGILSCSQKEVTLGDLEVIPLPNEVSLLNDGTSFVIDESTTICYPEDYQNLINKFNWMYDLGVRHFAIFFDDISGEGTNPLKQTELLNRLTEEFVKVKGDVSPLTVCPTDYSKLWANPTEKGSLAIYGKTLNPEIKVFWTGDVVCSDLTPETLDFINSRIKRPAYYWWNYPVTDYIRNFLLQGPVYGLDTSLTANETCGIVSNPMEHGEASKLALYGVADYTWNIANRASTSFFCTATM